MVETVPVFHRGARGGVLAAGSSTLLESGTRSPEAEALSLEAGARSLEPEAELNTFAFCGILRILSGGGAHPLPRPPLRSPLNPP